MPPSTGSGIASTSAISFGKNAAAMRMAPATIATIRAVTPVANASPMLDDDRPVAVPPSKPATILVRPMVCTPRETWVRFGRCHSASSRRSVLISTPMPSTESTRASNTITGNRASSTVDNRVGSDSNDGKARGGNASKGTAAIVSPRPVINPVSAAANRLAAQPITIAKKRAEPLSQTAATTMAARVMPPIRATSGTKWVAAEAPP